MPFIVPGIGYAGLGQQTAAAQQVFRQAMGSGRVARKGRKKRAARSAARRTARTRRTARSKSSSRSRSKPARLVRGSAAAKRYMAKIRKMRRR